MDKFEDTPFGLEKLKAQLETVDRSENADLEKKLAILGRDLTNIDDQELREEADTLDHLIVELGSIGKKEYSFLKIFGIEKNELVHSNFLAWILNPLESHGLGSQFVKRFLEKTASKAEYLDLSGIDLSRLLVQTELRTETSQLDICLMDPAGQFNCVIENKISSKEGDNQTKRLYKDNHGKCPKELFIFLTLSGYEKPEDEHFLSLTYGEVLPLLKNLLGLSSDDTRFLMKNYMNTLEGLIMFDEFKEYSVRTQLYYRFFKQIDEVWNAFEKDRKLLLSAFEKGIKQRKWWDDETWELQKTGAEVIFWRRKWYRGESDEGPYFEIRPSTQRPVVHLSLEGWPSAFSNKFAPILKNQLEKKSPSKKADGFERTLTGTQTFLEKDAYFSLTEKELVQKTLASVDEMIDCFEEIIERSLDEFG